jgi:ABC-2 type transport system permease protein
MTRLVNTELLKVRTTRTVWWLLIATLVLTALNLSLTVGFAGQQGSPPIDSELTQRNVFASAGAAYLFPLILGILGMTGEYRHQTVSATFLVEPRRGRVLAAKLIAYALLGLLFGVVSAILALALAFPLLRLRGVETLAAGVDVPAIMFASLAAMTLYAVVGVAIGALLRNQIAAIVGALVWVLVIEALVINLLPDVGKWFPGGAASAMLQANVPTGDLLPAWGGGLVFLAYGLVLAVAARLLTVRRDIT